MASELDPDCQRRVTALLDAWASWLPKPRCRPRQTVTQRLGTRHLVVMAEDSETQQRFALRVRKNNDSTDHASELFCIATARELEPISAKQFYQLSNAGEVFQWLDQPAELTAEALAILAAKIHQTPLPENSGLIPELNYSDALHKLAQHPIAKKVVTCDDAMHDLNLYPASEIDLLAEKLQPDAIALDASDKTFCHHDLTIRNILADGDELKAVDWDYACIGSPLFDLAAMTADLSAAQIMQTLSYYTHLTGLEISPSLWESARRMYFGMSVLWYLQSGVDAPEGLDYLRSHLT